VIPCQKFCRKSKTTCVLRRLVFEMHVTVKCKTLLSSVIYHDDIWSTQCTAGLSCDWMIMEYTHDEHCDMLLTLGDCNSRAGTAAREYALRYPGRRHPDGNVFRRLEQHFRETGSVTPTALVNAGRPRTVRTPANKDAIISAVKREPWRCSREITRDLGLFQPRVLEVLNEDELHPYHYSQSSHLFPDDRPLRMQFC
jgi:hypothetical protein